VHNALGPGFPESLYEEAMNRELTSRGVKLERQKKVVVNFKGKPLGEFVLDNVVNGLVILEYKAVSEVARIHEQQALSYLKLLVLNWRLLLILEQSVCNRVAL